MRYFRVGEITPYMGIPYSMWCLLLTTFGGHHPMLLYMAWIDQIQQDVMLKIDYWTALVMYAVYEACHVTIVAQLSHYQH